MCNIFFFRTKLNYQVLKILQVYSNKLWKFKENINCRHFKQIQKNSDNILIIKLTMTLKRTSYLTADKSNFFNKSINIQVSTNVYMQKKQKNLMQIFDLFKLVKKPAEILWILRIEVAVNLIHIIYEVESRNNFLLFVKSSYPSPY